LLAHSNGFHLQGNHRHHLADQGENVEEAGGHVLGGEHGHVIDAR
jgi:hypothetical protein